MAAREANPNNWLSGITRVLAQSGQSGGSYGSSPLGYVGAFKDLLNTMSDEDPNYQKGLNQLGGGIVGSYFGGGAGAQLGTMAGGLLGEGQRAAWEADPNAYYLLQSMTNPLGAAGSIGMGGSFVGSKESGDSGDWARMVPAYNLVKMLF